MRREIQLLHQSAEALPPRGADLSAFAGGLSTAAPAFGVWFRQSFRRHLCGPQELAAGLLLEEIRAFPDGAVYRIGPAGMAAAVKTGR